MSDCQKTQRIKRKIYPIKPSTLPLKGHGNTDEKKADK